MEVFNRKLVTRSTIALIYFSHRTTVTVILPSLRTPTA